MGKFIEDYVTPVDSIDMSKLISKMDSLEVSFQSIQGRGPYKPQVATQSAGILRNSIIGI